MQGLKFSWCHIGCYMECCIGCSDTNKKQIIEVLSTPRDEFIKTK